MKGKIIYECVEHIKKALSIADEVCQKRGHTILRVDNNLLEREQEVKVIIKVKDAICQMRLSLKQDETPLHFINSLQTIESSPVGTLLSSALYLSKEVEYSLFRNCHDVVEFLTEKKTDDKTLQAALYFLERLG